MGSNDAESCSNFDLEVHPGSFRKSLLSNTTAQAQRVANPYQKYLIRLRVAAAEAKRGQSLESKAEEITSNIIRNFLEWYNSLGGAANENTINEATLHQLFRIGFDTYVENDADAEVPLNIPELPENLQQYEARCRQSYTIQDGEMVQINEKDDNLSPLRHGPNYFLQALGSLEDMSKVWQGIEDLWSTTAFAAWLKKHPEMEPPLYLKNCGLIDLDFPSLVMRSEELCGPSIEERLLLPEKKKICHFGNSTAYLNPFGRACKCPIRNKNKRPSTGHNQ